MEQQISTQASVENAILQAQQIEMVYHEPGSLTRSATFNKVLHGIDLSIAKGQTLGVVGESGCGKSTLARILLGLMRPTSGTIRLNGQELSSLSVKQIARVIQPIFQDPFSSLNPRKTIAQIVQTPLNLHRIGTNKERQEQVKSMLDQVGMPQRTLSQYPSQLSGGQRQRVAIARALILQPQLIICDEPTSALDVSVQAQILNLLMDLKDQFGLSYIFISHDLGVVEYLVDRVMVMYKGRVVEENTTTEIFQQAQHPYTKMLLASALDPDPRLGVPQIDRSWMEADASA